MIRLPSSSVRLAHGSPSPLRSPRNLPLGPGPEPEPAVGCPGSGLWPLTTTGLRRSVRRVRGSVERPIPPSLPIRSASRVRTASYAANPSVSLCLLMGKASFGPPGYRIAHKARPISPFCFLSQGMLTTHSQLGQLKTAIRISCSGCEYPNVATISRRVVL